MIDPLPNPDRRHRLRWLLFAAAAFLWLWLAVFFIVGDRLPYLGYVNAAGAWISLLGGCAGLALFALRQRAFGAATVLLAVWSLSLGLAPAFLHSHPSGRQSELRIVTASLRGRNRDMAAAADRLLSYRPDIITVQEVSDPATLAVELRARDGQKWHMAAKSFLVVFSRYPIELLPDAGEPLKTRVLLGPSQSLSVWTLRAPKDYLMPVVNNRFFVDLAVAIKRERPDIVTGDFNSSPWNDGYRIMQKLLKDSFRERGVGPGFTFPSPARVMGAAFPFVRLDYIFVAPGVTVKKTFVGRASRGADHHPVVADLAV